MKLRPVLTAAMAAILAMTASSTSAQAASDDTRYGVHLPLTLIGGENFWGGYLDVLHAVGPNLAIGGETGFLTRAPTGTRSVSVHVIPITMKGIYTFDTARGARFTPFAGAAMGAGVILRSASSGSTSASDFDGGFQALAHLGARFGDERRFTATLRLGLLHDDFVFAPSIGYYF